MRDIRKMEEDERKHRLETIVKGADSDYWKILEEKVKEMVEVEERYQDGFKRKGMKEEWVNDYTRSVDQVYFLKRFLKINDVLIGQHKTFTEKASDLVNEIFERSTSFVGKIKEDEANG